MNNCIFCKIISKTIPSKIAGESANALAFHDNNPQAPVHVLIVPKEHVTSILDVKGGHAQALSEMVLLAQDVARKEKVDGTGFRLVFNCGPDAGQAVDHLHMHLLGRRKLHWPPG